MRQPFMAGNWKMNKTVREGVALVEALAEQVATIDDVTIAVCPPFTALDAVGKALKGTNIALGAQDMYWENQGAYTGEVSPTLLRDVGCTYVIVGHSERRGRFGTLEKGMTEELLSVFGDNDATVNKKTRSALRRGLRPIICCGELLSERQAGQTDDVVVSQVRAALKGVTEKQMTKVTLAYEPVWAIGTGEVCDADEADRVCGLIRKTIGRLYRRKVANATIIQYGGSVKPANIDGLIAKPNIDGGLVGGASLNADDFAALVSAVSR